MVVEAFENSSVWRVKMGSGAKILNSKVAGIQLHETKKNF